MPGGLHAGHRSATIKRPRDKVGAYAVRARTGSRLRVLVADDDIVLASAVTRFFARTYDALPFEAKLANILRRAADEVPNLIFLDLRFPNGETSIPLLAGMRDTCPAAVVVVMTGAPELLSIQRALDAGVRGYLVKCDGDGLPEYRRAAERVLGGEIYLSSSARVQLARETASVIGVPDDWEADVSRLMMKADFSRASAEVAVPLHHGLIAKQIAGRLGLPLATVRGRLRHIYVRHQIVGMRALILHIERILSRPSKA